MMDARAEKEEIFKIDRKLSFSSVLNRNSESYKQSRFRRASSFSFMPKDSSTTTSEIRSFESNLRIRHRPRPKSLNLSQAIDSERDCSMDSLQRTDSAEDKKEPSKSRTPLDSIVEMAAAWLEESKSIMQSRYCSLAPENFDCIKEEKVENGTKGIPEEDDVGAEAKQCRSKYEGGCMPGNTNRCQVSGKKNMSEGIVVDSDCISIAGGRKMPEAKASGTKYCESPCPMTVDISDNSNDLISHITKDSNTSYISDFAKAGEDVSYLEDVRELLKGLKGKRTFEERSETARVVNIDCSLKGIGQEGFLEEHEDDNAALNGHCEEIHGSFGSPLLDLKFNRGMDGSKFNIKQQLDHEELCIETDEACKLSFDAAKEADCTNTKCGEEERSLIKEGLATDRENNEQQDTRINMKNSAGFTEPYNSHKQAETLVVLGTSPPEVPMDMVRHKSHNFLQTVLKDQISSNEPQDLKEKSFDILPGALVKRSVRPRSFTSSGNVKVTMTELQYLPPVKKNRRRRTCSFGASRYDRKPRADTQEVCQFNLYIDVSIKYRNILCIFKS